jgi:hypothetical protein
MNRCFLLRYGRLTHCDCARVWNRFELTPARLQFATFLQLTNNRTDRPTDLYVTLDKLSLASRHYRLEALPGQFSTDEQVGNVLQIGWQERMTIHYRVIPLDEESKTCLLSECPFTEKAACETKECVASEATDYLCLERACETFEVCV